MQNLPLLRIWLVLLAILTAGSQGPAGQDAKPISFDLPASAQAVEDLTSFLHGQTGLAEIDNAEIDNAEIDNAWVAEQGFADVALTREDASRAKSVLAKYRQQRLRESRQEELRAGTIEHGEYKMPFFYKTFGERPEGGWSLYISLHGGGGAPAAVNDQQWENQKCLYSLKEGIYLAPRAPTNAWDLWHQQHIDPMLQRLIEDLVVIEGVNWNRVYLMGYSAGGDGVYQLAPRIADRWAAASMMAGHPNETSPLGLRNVPFTLQVGGKDAAYDRNKIAEQWKKKLADLHAADPQGYRHLVKIYPDKGHWMDREDAVAISWMAQHTRNPVPRRVVWKQDDVTHSHFYWLEVDRAKAQPGTEIVAQADGQTVTLSGQDMDTVIVHLDDRLVDLDLPVKVVSNGATLFEGTLQRTIRSLARTLEDRQDPNLAFAASVSIDLPRPSQQSPVPKE